jgi:hypothetical protein
LKYARPAWNKGTKIVQFAMSLVLVVYWVFFMKVGDEQVTPFDAVSSYRTTSWNVERGTWIVLTWNDSFENGLRVLGMMLGKYPSRVHRERMPVIGEHQSKDLWHQNSE